MLGPAVTQNDAPALYHPLPGDTEPAPEGLTAEVK